MTPREVVELWVQAFNRTDTDGLAALYSEDAVNHQVAEAPRQGRAAIHVVAGQIVFQRGYWDKLIFLRQQGLPLSTE